jgi:hypothetical protein
MAQIAAGGSGVFVAQLFQDGQVPPLASIPLSSGATWSWTCSDPEAVLTPDSADPTGGTVTVFIPTSDTNLHFSLTATTEYQGNAVEYTQIVTIIQPPPPYSVGIAQVNS